MLVKLHEAVEQKALLSKKNKPITGHNDVLNGILADNLQSKIRLCLTICVLTSFMKLDPDS